MSEQSTLCKRKSRRLDAPRTRQRDRQSSHGRGRPQFDASLLCVQVEHTGTMAPEMMNMQELQDNELISQAREWRRRALRGEKDARGIAHELEREVRHRFGVRETVAQQPLPDVRLLGVMPQSVLRRRKPW